MTRGGPQSAALLVVGPQPGALPSGYPDDPVIDLRVDDSRDPVGDLRRLLTTARAHRHLIRAGLPDTDADLVAAELRAAVATAPEDPTVLRAAGITLALSGFTDEARPLLDRAIRLQPRVRHWARVSGERAQRAGNPHGATLLNWLDARA